MLQVSNYLGGQEIYMYHPNCMELTPAKCIANEWNVEEWSTMSGWAKDYNLSMTCGNFPVLSYSTCNQ